MLTLYDFILLLGIVGLLWLKWGCGWQGRYRVMDAWVFFGWPGNPGWAVAGKIGQSGKNVCNIRRGNTGYLN